MTLNLNGTIPPGKVKFTCRAINVSSITWSFDDKLITTYNASGNSQNRSEKIESLYPHVSVVISSVERSNLSKDSFDIVSTLTVSSTSLADVSSIECGSGGVRDRIFNILSPNPAEVMLSEDSSINLTSNFSHLHGDICSECIQFTCDAENLDYLEWLFNDYSLIKYSYSKGDVFPLNLCNNSTDNDHLDSLCKSASFFINSVTESSGSDNRYNFLSTLTFQEDYISSNSIRAVQCGSDKIKDRIFTNFTVLCKETKPSHRVETCDQTHLKYICEFCLGNASVPCDTLWKYRNKVMCVYFHVWSVS